MADTFSPPDDVRAAAKRALVWISEGKAGSGFTDVGRKRASDLARGASISQETLVKMRAYFARHEVDARAEGFRAGEKGFPSPGRVAWDAWGGDPGRRWANAVLRRLEAKKHEDIREVSAQFKITFPIAKSEKREDGYYIVGEASGTEIDSTMERMSPEAIDGFAAQISARALMDPLPYRDAHAPDGVLRDLGSIVRGWITENMRLGIEVKLDDQNPAALYLYRQLQKGKQYGMSVAGLVNRYADETVAGISEKVRTYYDVSLTEISNTTRPAWTPSFGTVLSKAIDEAAASSAEKGENLMDEELRVVGEEMAPVDAAVVDAAAEQPVAEEVVETPAADEVVAEPVAEEPVAEAVVEEAEKSAPCEDGCECDECKAEVVVEEAPVEKAGRSISAANAARLMALYEEMTNTLKDLGVVEGEVVDAAKSDSTADESTETVAEEITEKAVEADPLTAKVEELQRALAEATARIEELENTPAVVAPPVIERSEPTIDEAVEAIKSLSPSERLRLGFALAKREGR